VILIILPEEEMSMIAARINAEFQQYLRFYEIDSVCLSIVAHVRYGTVYNAKNGIPVTPENAQRIREGVLNLTGIAYTGSLPVLTVSDSLFDDRHWSWLSR
jgi:hypothetical protein